MKSIFQFIKKILSGFWKVVNETRKFTLNLMFFLFFLIILISLAGVSDKKTEIIPDESALLLSIYGDIVEQKTYSDPMSTFISQSSEDARPQETLLKDIIDVIKTSKDDNRIKILVLDLINMNGAGLSKLSEIGNALTDFKKSGKKVIATGDYYTQGQYYLASHANEIYMHPMGRVLMTGFGTYRLFLKEALTKLKINFNVFIAGKYKSALEPFIRNNMSKEAKEANSKWLNVLWANYIKDISLQRNLSEEKIESFIKNTINDLSKTKGDPGLVALNNGLIDNLLTRDQVKAKLISLVGLNEKEDDFKQVSFYGYLKNIKYKIDKKNPLKDKVGIIVAKGNILNGKQPEGSIGGDSLSKLIRQARENEKIKAVVLRVDSGGGSAFASEIIRREIELTQESGIPVILSMGSVAASGGYWIGATADEIYASPSTITGSIGVFGAFPTFDKSLKHLGINNDGIGTTDKTSWFDPTRPMDPEARESMQMIIENIYNNFITIVAKGRKMSPENVDKIAQGRVWAGYTAHKIGLVDKLGDLDDAVKGAALKAGLSDYETLYVKRSLSAREQFIKQLSNQISVLFQSDDSYTIHPVTTMIRKMSGELKGYLKMNDPQGAYAKCLNCPGE